MKEEFSAELKHIYGTGQFQLLFNTVNCKLCNKLMMPGWFYKIPKRYRDLFEGVRQSYDNPEYCESCKKSGAYDCQCEICCEVKPSNEMQISIGYPAEYLCKSCFETTSAKKWEKMVEQLEEDHKWDHL